MGRFNPLGTLLKVAEHRPLGAQYRARMVGASGSGFATDEPMTVYDRSRHESGDFCTLSSATTIEPASASDGRQLGPQDDARDHRRKEEVA
jgi:hypothetical protein